MSIHWHCSTPKLHLTKQMNGGVRGEEKEVKGKGKGQRVRGSVRRVSTPELLMR